MGRPAKEKNLLMNRPLRIMLTAAQDEMIRRAAAVEGLDLTAWVRPVLLTAARQRVDTATLKKTK